MRKVLLCFMIIFLLSISGCNSIDSSSNNNNIISNVNGATDVSDDVGTDVSDDVGTDVSDVGLLRTVLNGGEIGATSLPHYVSTEIVKSCLISECAVPAKVFLGHPTFRDSVAFSDFVLNMSELQNCTFSIVANYNGEKYITVMEDVDYIDSSYNVIIKDLYDEYGVYKGSIVNYSKYNSVNLDIASMKDVPYGYVNIELQIQLPDQTTFVVMSDTLYYSVTDVEIFFGLVSNPIAHEGDLGIITTGWTYEGK